MRKSICVIEGADGGGKTTLAKHLEKWGYSYDHRGAPEKPALDYYLEGLESGTGRIVLDRLHVGSYVYGKVFRGMDDLTEYEHWTLEGAIYGQGGQLVYANPPVEAMDAALAGGPADSEAVIYEASEKQLQVRMLYGLYMETMTNLPVVEYDWTRPDAPKVIDQVLDAHNDYDLNAMFPAEIPVLGNQVNPRYVFVGDEQTDDLRALARYSYYAGVPFQRCTSGRYLHRALVAGKVPMRDYCIVNSLQADDRTIDQFLPWDEYYSMAEGWENAEVVALGNLASERLRKAGITHRKAPHPSYWKRFHYRQIFDYAKQLKGES